MILFLGFLFMIFFFAVCIVASKSNFMLINLPALVLILIPLFFFLFVSKSGKIIGKYISISFKKNYTYTKTELEKLSLAIKNTIKYTLAVGVFCFTAFTVTSLGFLGSPELLGPNLAMCLLSLTYSIAIGFFVFFPAFAWAENKLSNINNSDKSYSL